jgi:hypothetical protein
VLETLFTVLVHSEKPFSEGQQEISNAIAAYKGAVGDLIAFVEIKKISGI